MRSRMALTITMAVLSVGVIAVDPRMPEATKLSPLDRRLATLEARLINDASELADGSDRASATATAMAIKYEALNSSETSAKEHVVDAKKIKWLGPCNADPKSLHESDWGDWRARAFDDGHWSNWIRKSRLLPIPKSGEPGSYPDRVLLGDIEADL